MSKMCVLLGEDENLCNIFSVKQLCFYEKISEQWTKVKSILFQIDDEVQAMAMRHFASELAAILKEEDSPILIGKEIIGIIYQWLDKEGIIMCETEEISDLLFRQIEEDFLIEKEGKMEVVEEVPIKPYEVSGGGDYYLDFEKLQKYHPELTSKKVLLPFLCNDLYVSLTIRCSHIMPWLELFVEEQGLSMKSERKDGIYTVYLTHGLCKEE